MYDIAKKIRTIDGYKFEIVATRKLVSSEIIDWCEKYSHVIVESTDSMVVVEVIKNRSIEDCNRQRDRNDSFLKLGAYDCYISLKEALGDFELNKDFEDAYKRGFNQMKQAIEKDLDFTKKMLLSSAPLWRMDKETRHKLMDEQTIQIDLKDIISASAYFNWSWPYCGFGQFSFSKDEETGNLVCMNECMSRENIRKILHALADTVADNVII